MSTASERIFNSLIQHQMLLIKYFRSQKTEMLKILDNDNDKLFLQIYSDLKDMTKSLTKTEEERWVRLFRKIKELRKNNIEIFKSKFKDDLQNIIDKELKYILDLFQKEIPLELQYEEVKDKDKIIPFALIHGKTFDRWFSEFEYRDNQIIQNAITQGFSQGLTATQIIEMIEGKRLLRYNDGELQKSRRNAVSLINTVGLGIAGYAMNMFTQANSKYVVAWRYEAILDGRTSLFCAEHDGRIYSIELVTAPYPPNHPNCRSRAVYIFSTDTVGNRIVTKDRDGKTRVIDFGKEAKYKYPDKWKSLSDTQKQKYIDEMRLDWFDENIGGLPQDIKYSDWFAKQSATFQRTYLGNTRYELYSKGGLKFNQFVDYDGSTILLDDLYRLYPNAYAKAGI